MFVVVYNMLEARLGKIRMHCPHTDAPSLAEHEYGKHAKLKVHLRGLGLTCPRIACSGCVALGLHLSLQISSLVQASFTSAFSWGSCSPDLRNRNSDPHFLPLEVLVGSVQDSQHWLL